MASVKWAKLVELHNAWQVDDDDGSQLSLVDEDLRDMDLSGLDLARCKLLRCDLRGVDVRRSDLTSSDLRGSDFRKADLRGADLSRCEAEDADFENADLRQATFIEADLTNADLTGVSGEESDFEGAIIEDAKMRGADFDDADFTNTVGEPTSFPRRLENAKLVGSKLHPLLSASISDLEHRLGITIHRFFTDGEYYVLIMDDNTSEGFVITEDNLWSSVESCTGVHEEYEVEHFWMSLDFISDPTVRYDAAHSYSQDLADVGVMLKGYSTSDVQTAVNEMEDEFENNVLVYGPESIHNTAKEGVLLFGSYSDVDHAVEAVQDFLKMPTPTARTSYGKKRKAVDQLGKVTSQMKMASFKRTFPDAFEAVKRDIPKQTIDKQTARRLIDKFGMVWQVSFTVWDSDLQRLSPDPNEVMQLNVDMRALTSDETILNTLEAIRRTSYRSEHPVVVRGPLMTVGWVRYTDEPKRGTIIIEEVQSDLPTVRKATTDEEFRKQLEEQGGKKAVDAALDMMEPFTKRFYEDALAAVFDLAAERGRRYVEMLTYETKKQFESPMSIYTKLPKSMGMKKTKKVRSSVPDVSEVWSVDVALNNPRRRLRKIGSTWSRARGFGK